MQEVSDSSPEKKEYVKIKIGVWNENWLHENLIDKGDMCLCTHVPTPDLLLSLSGARTGPCVSLEGDDDTEVSPDSSCHVTT